MPGVDYQNYVKMHSFIKQHEAELRSGATVAAPVKASTQPAAQPTAPAPTPSRPSISRPSRLLTHCQGVSLPCPGTIPTSRGISLLSCMGLTPPLILPSRRRNELGRTLPSPLGSRRRICSSSGADGGRKAKCRPKRSLRRREGGFSAEKLLGLFPAAANTGAPADLRRPDSRRDRRRSGCDPALPSRPEGDAGRGDQRHSAGRMGARRWKEDQEAGSSRQTCPNRRSSRQTCPSRPTKWPSLGLKWKNAGLRTKQRRSRMPFGR